MNVDALNRGKALGKQYLEGSQVDHIAIQAYLSKGYKCAIMRYSQQLRRNEFLLGWWYVGYPYFGMMIEDREGKNERRRRTSTH